MHDTTPTNDQKTREYTYEELHELAKEMADDIKEIHAIMLMLVEQVDNYEPPTWLNSEQVMQLIKISKATLKRWRSFGALPYIVFRNNAWYRYSDVMGLFKEGGKCKD